MIIGKMITIIRILFRGVFLLAARGIAWRNKLSREKLSRYECGFDPIGNSRRPFSLRFFLLAIIFLIFDVELIFLFPYISGILSCFRVLNVGLKIGFLFILGWGLFHE